MITGISPHIQTHSRNYELGFLPIFEKPLYLKKKIVGEMEKETQSHFWFQSSTFEGFTCLIRIVFCRLITCTMHIVNLTDVWVQIHDFLLWPTYFLFSYIFHSIAATNSATTERKYLSYSAALELFSSTILRPTSPPDISLLSLLKPGFHGKWLCPWSRSLVKPPFHGLLPQTLAVQASGVQLLSSYREGNRDR